MKISAFVRFILAVTWLALGPIGARAADSHYVLVAQPVFEPKIGLFISYQTYIDLADTPPPGQAIGFTCTPSSVPVADGTKRVLDQNVASRLGFKIRVSAPDLPAGAKQIDTLDVALDLTHVVPAEGFALRSATTQDEGVESALRATIECVQDNAARDRFGIRYVRIHIDGPERYQRFARTYEVGPATVRVHRPRGG